MADIFLSYAREDEARIKALAAALEAQGWSVFWDRRIPAGESWRSFIGAALQSARCIVVAWTKDSVDSQWVLEEADEGRQRGILVPVMLDPVLPPRGFKEIQVADLSAWQPEQASERFDQLVADIGRMLARQAGAPARPTPEIPAKPIPSTATPPAAPGRGRGVGMAIGAALVALVAVGYFLIPDSKPPTVVVQPPDRGTTVREPVRDSATGAWLVVVSSLRSSERQAAQDLRGRLASAGLDAVLVDSNDFPLLTPNLLVVGIGPFASREQANAALERVKPLRPDAYVKKAR